jgi:uncharacterized protein
VKHKQKETRCMAVKELRVAAAGTESGGIGTLEGYAAVFDSWSEDLGFFREKIQKGAFANALKNSDCRALINHQPGQLLGRQSARTLRLSEDDKGLFMSVDLPDTQYARDLKVSVERGDITQQSFGFCVKTDVWVEDRETGKTERTIMEVDELFDVSPVTFPAYADTTVAKRSLEQYRNAESRPGNFNDDQAGVENEFDDLQIQLIKECIDHET